MVRFRTYRFSGHRLHENGRGFWQEPQWRAGWKCDRRSWHRLEESVMPAKMITVAVLQDDLYSELFIVVSLFLYLQMLSVE